MHNILREEWLHGPDADPDPSIAEAVALITEHQLGLLSDIDQKSVRRRLSSDANFASTAAALIIAEQVVRYDADLQYHTEEESAKMAKILARMDAERAMQTVQRDLASSSRKRGRLNFNRPLWQLAAAMLIAITITMGAVSAYGAVLHSRIPPVSITFKDAPLSVVMAELRRRYQVSVEVCDAGFNQDRVTLTVNDAPIDSIADIIARQTLRWAHWKVPYTGGEYTLLLQPQPDISRGWRYNIRLFARSFTYLGCHR